MAMFSGWGLRTLAAGEHLAEQGSPGKRDAITLLDENGAVLDAPAPLWQALAARDWRRLCIDLRPLWQQARLVPVGDAHALGHVGADLPDARAHGLGEDIEVRVHHDAAGELHLQTADPHHQQQHHCVCRNCRRNL